MTGNEQALYAEMQNRGYSHGLCMTALRILSTAPQAVSDMLAYLYDEQPSEKMFIAEIARICESNGINIQ